MLAENRDFFIPAAFEVPVGGRSPAEIAITFGKKNFTVRHNYRIP